MPGSKSRLLYLDWMRGLAVFLMIQTHAFESFLRLDQRGSEWFWLSQYLGGMPAPLFLFLAGVSLALVMDRSKEKRLEKVLKRAGWIFLLAYAFRFEQAAEWYPYSDWSGVWKVDILNCIAVSTLAAGLCAAGMRNRPRAALAMTLIGAGIVIVTPFVFLVRSGVPRLLLDYINGGDGHSPFMFFSWGAFTFAGAAVGHLLLEARARADEERFILSCGALGVFAFAAGFFINVYPDIEYGFYDYSRTSPQYFLVRLGYMLMFLYMSYRWASRKGSGWSPLLAFGQTSLLIYWLHLEVVYGRLRLFRNTLGIGATAAQLLWIVPLMLAISVARLRWTARKETV